MSRVVGSRIPLRFADSALARELLLKMAYNDTPYGDLPVP